MTPVAGTGFALTSELHENKHSVSFKIFKLYNGNEWEEVGDGFLKWDECLNLSIGEGCKIHFCGREEAKELAALTDAIYDLGPLMESWDEG